MQKKLLFDNQPFHFSQGNLPCLIHGKEKSGASLFTISLVADLAVQREKQLFLCGYQMARDEFVSQMGTASNTKLIANEEELGNVSKVQTVFIKREKPELFLSALRVLPDIENRIILIKNIELFDHTLFDAVTNLDNLIISGNLDNCSFAGALKDKSWNSRIFFSSSKVEFGIVLPTLDRYQGYFQGKGKVGRVSLQV